MMKGNYNAKKDPNYVPKVYPNLVVRAFSMVSEGLQYCRQKFWARLVVFRSSIGFQYGAMDVLMVVFSETLPGNSTLNLAFLYLSLGIGSFIGPVAGTRSPTLKQCQLIGIFGMILNFSGIAGMGITNILVNNLWVVCLFNIVRASGGKIAGVNSRLMLNRLADDRMMGRVMALDYIGFVLMSSCGAILCGVLEDYYSMDGSETTFVIVGILAFVTLTWVIYHNNNKGAASPECVAYDEKKVPSIKNGHAEDDDSEDNTNPFFLWLPVVMAATLGIYFALKSDLTSTDDDDDTVVMSLQNATSYDSCFIKPEFSYLYPPGVKLSDFGV
mmetsp:Transcript_14729/g.21218  ORF Transcript_14729/g.21218 Transcript_14729/m.21218 type:complete len:328 (+) Transcript_14729:100-1083(+)